MKNLLLFTLFSVSIISNAIAQDDPVMDDYVKHHEVKLNGLMLILGAFEPSYEYNINEESSVGASVFIPFSTDEDISSDINYYISPYYRHFFGKKFAAGFFVEGFAMLNSVDRGESYYEYPADAPVLIENENNYTDLALGIGLGGKWVTKRGFVFEINAGLGRNFFNSDESDVDLVGKLGFNLGYRF